jgi:hypothetical protein
MATFTLVPLENCDQLMGHWTSKLETVSAHFTGETKHHVRITTPKNSKRVEAERFVMVRL